MKTRCHILIPAVLIAGGLSHGETLSSADREALLERLEKIREDANSMVNAKFGIALAAFRAASASNDAALEFYIKCVEKVDFSDNRRKASDFRDWKRRESDRLSDSAIGPALRLQLRWLILTLRASSETSDKEELASSAREILDAIFADAEKLRGQLPILNQAVTGTVFARAYELTDVKVDQWPLSPAQIGPIYERILLPPLRQPTRVPELRAAWLRRIQQEILKQEHWSGGKADSPKRIGTVAALRPPEYQRFITENVPELQWQMEMDLFKSGDESASALRMLAHLENHIDHPSSREWTEAFRGMLSADPQASSPPAVDSAPIP